MSEQHKGLIEAVKEVMPLAEHRQCARHIYEGFRKQFPGVKFRQLFWDASKASYPPLHNKVMEKIKRANPRAHDFLIKKDPKSWSRAFFREGVCCEAIENGFSECFNAVLVSLRHKPIITMLESMRVLVMERMHTMRVLMEKWKGDICPNIQNILEHSKDQQRFWHVVSCGGNKFEVRKGYDAFKVDEPNRTCSCRMWQISGLPCCHAIACIFKLNRKVEDYVPECFRKDRYLLTYGQYMKPVDGIDFWPDVSHLSRILGPIPKTMPGRPKRKRVRASHEKKSTTKISRAGIVMTCQNCGETGHNRKGCLNQPKPAPCKEKGKAGRPFKKQNTETHLVDDHDIPRFVNTDINEFEMGATNMRGVLGDGRLFYLGKQKKKRGGASIDRGHLKMRGGRTKSGRLIPAQRVARMGTWLATDGATSDTIEDEQRMHSGMPGRTARASNEPNIAATQESQMGGSVNLPSNVVTRSRKAAASEIVEVRRMPGGARGGASVDRGGRGGTKQLLARKTMSAEAQPVQHTREKSGPKLLPPRLPSQRILSNKLAAPPKGPGSSVDNEIVLD